jgi:hypothetical protein
LQHVPFKVVPPPKHIKTDDTGAFLIDPKRIASNPRNPRKRFRSIPALARAIAKVGHLTPGTVVFIKHKDFDAMLIDGERRLKAILYANEHGLGENTIMYRAHIQTVRDGREQHMKAFAANFGKEDHDCIEIAEAIRDMIADGYSRDYIREIAGKSITWVYQHESLLKLHPEVQALLVPGENDEVTTVGGDVQALPRETGNLRSREPERKLAFSVALLLVDLPHEHQRRYAKQILFKQMSMDEARRHVHKEARKIGLSVSPRSSEPKRRFASLMALTGVFKGKIGIFLDMPNSELDMMLANVGPKSRKLLLDGLQEFTSEMCAFVEALDRKSKKLETVSPPS